MTFTARFKIQDIGDGPTPINVLASANIEDGSLTQNTEKVSSMELRFLIDADNTTLLVGDIISVTGHFIS